MSIMSVQEWAETILLPNNDFTACYIALIEGDDGYDLEVEIDPGTIASTYFGAGELEQARSLADQLDALLTHRGITVYQTRDEWENSWDDDEDD